MAAKTGQCLCGAVRFQAKPVSNAVSICHCGMCRRQMAGPFFAIECGGSFKVEESPELGVYSASDYGERIFCKKCGTVIAWLTKDKKFSEVSVNALDGMDDLRLAQEIFIEDKPGYYSFAEKTKKMTGAEVWEEFAAMQNEK